MSSPDVPFTTRPELKGTFGMASSTHWMATQCAMAVLETGALGDQRCKEGATGSRLPGDGRLHRHHRDRSLSRKAGSARARCNAVERIDGLRHDRCRRGRLRSRATWDADVITKPGSI